MSKILIVEDEENISELIRDTLSLENYETECSFDGEDAIQKINSNKYDLVLLDIMLPKLDGFEVVKHINNISEIPVIFLSAKKDITSIVKGLKIGGQDYITKPFEPLELLARVELRLNNSKNNNIIEYKDIKVNTLERIVYKNDEKIDLSPKEYELFLLLINNIDVALSRDDILDKIWGISVDVETRTIDYHIQQLRKKLNLKENIKAVNKIGYRLEK